MSVDGGVGNECEFVSLVNRATSSRTMVRSVTASKVLNRCSGVVPFPNESTSDATSSALFAALMGDRFVTKSM